MINDRRKEIAMKLVCPLKDCTEIIDIGSKNRFECFSCNKGHYFRGIDADVDRRLITSLINSLTCFSVERLDQAACPHCSGLVPLTKKESTRSGYYAPDFCMYCGNDLPTRTAHALQEKDLKRVQNWLKNPKALNEGTVIMLSEHLEEYEVRPDQAEMIQKIVDEWLDE